MGEIQRDDIEAGKAVARRIQGAVGGVVSGARYWLAGDFSEKLRPAKAPCAPKSPARQRGW